MWGISAAGDWISTSTGRISAMNIAASAMVMPAPRLSEANTSRRNAARSPLPYICARITEMPVQKPVSTKMNRFMIVPAMPTAEKASVPRKRLIISESTVLYICWSTLPISSGMDSEISSRRMFPSNNVAFISIHPVDILTKPVCRGKRFLLLFHYACVKVIWPNLDTSWQRFDSGLTSL